MDIAKLRELDRDEDVTVITKGNYQLVDVASQTRIPPLTEVTTPLTPFIENEIRKGNLTLTSESDAPKAKGDAKNVDELKYNSTSVPAESTRESRKAIRNSDNSSTGNEAMTSETVKPQRNSRKAAETSEE